MRMNYKTYPTDYVQELKATSRKKARAFLEYWDDMEHGEHNSLRFYAQSWEIGKSTVQRWQEEFNQEIDLFLSHWSLRNNQHNSYAKKSMGHQQDKWDSEKTQNIRTSNNSEGQQRDKALNNNNNNGQSNFLFDKNFNDFFFVYSRNTKFVGKKQEAYEVFANTDVNVNLLKLAAMKYLHDEAVDRPVGIKKFLENELYLPYLPTYMRVKSGDEWYEGIYDNKSFEFKDADGCSLGTIEPKLLIELYEKNELIYLKVLDKKAS